MTRTNKPWRSLAVSAIVAASLASPAAAQLLNSGKPNPPREEAVAVEETTAPVATETFSRSTQIFGQWSVQCSERSGRESCFIETVIRQAGERPRELVVLRVNHGEEGLFGTIVTPNRTALPRGVTLKVGEVEHTANYVTCGPVNCHARFEADDDFGAAMQTGEKLDAIIYVFANAAVRGISIPVELAGFREAYERLQIIDPQ